MVQIYNICVVKKIETLTITMTPSLYMVHRKFTYCYYLFKQEKRSTFLPCNFLNFNLFSHSSKIARSASLCVTKHEAIQQPGLFACFTIHFRFIWLPLFRINKAVCNHTTNQS